MNTSAMNKTTVEPILNKIKFPIYFDKESGMFFDQEGQMIAELRGWGWIQKLADETTAGELQDNFGKVIAEILNKELQSPVSEQEGNLKEVLKLMEQSLRERDGYIKNLESAVKENHVQFQEMSSNQSPLTEQEENKLAGEYIDGYNAGLSSRWVKAIEELPKEHKLIVFKSRGMYFTGWYYDEDDNFTDVLNGTFPVEDVEWLDESPQPPLTEEDIERMAAYKFPLDDARKNMFHDNSGQYEKRKIFKQGIKTGLAHRGQLSREDMERLKELISLSEDGNLIHIELIKIPKQ